MDYYTLAIARSPPSLDEDPTDETKWQVRHLCGLQACFSLNHLSYETDLTYASRATCQGRLEQCQHVIKCVEIAPVDTFPPEIPQGSRGGSGGSGSGGMTESAVARKQMLSVVLKTQKLLEKGLAFITPIVDTTTSATSADLPKENPQNFVGGDQQRQVDEFLVELKLCRKCI